MSVLKGNDAGVRNEVGNLSAPWLLVPFFAAAGVRAGRLVVGAAVGLLATVAALCAFYIANAFVLDLGPHTVLESMRLTFVTRWFLAALVSGPLAGALGAAWRRRGLSHAGLAMTALLMAEPVFWALANRAGGVDSFAFDPSPAVSVGEAIAGLVACTCLYAAVRHARAFNRRSVT
jgi:hypothetical protein